MKNLILLCVLTATLSSLHAQDLLSDYIQTRKWKADTYLNAKGDGMHLSFPTRAKKTDHQDLKTKAILIDDQAYDLYLSRNTLILKDKAETTLLKINTTKKLMFAADDRTYKRKGKLWLNKEIEYLDENGNLVLEAKLRGRRIEINFAQKSDPNLPYLAAFAFEEMIQYARGFYGLGGDFPVVIIP